MDKYEYKNGLLNQLAFLNDRLIDLNRETLKRSVLREALPTELRDDYNRTTIDEYITELEGVNKRITWIEGELLKLSDCDQLLAIVGRELHNAFKDKHPITKNTKVRAVELTNGQRNWHYTRLQTTIFNPLEEMSPIVHAGRGVVEFELWANRRYRFLLAYAADIDTVFLGQPHR